MTRTDAVVLKPQNNVWTALTGAACVALIVAIVMLYLKWRDVAGPDAPLFFGLF